MYMYRSGFATSNDVTYSTVNDYNTCVVHFVTTNTLFAHTYYTAMHLFTHDTHALNSEYVLGRAELRCRGRCLVGRS